MARRGMVDEAGNPVSLLDELHAPGCDGREFSKCEAVIQPPLPEDPPDKPDQIVVVVMEWCGRCGAADWEVV